MSSGAAWRPMRPEDVIPANRIGDAVHTTFPEDDAVMQERLRLHPRGCLVLERDGALIGYCTSHPWRRRAPPALNTLLGALPAHPETYYVHDVALLPAARGLGAGAAVMRLLEAEARALALAEMALVAVYDAARYWSRHGFVAVTDDAALRAGVERYDPQASYMERVLG